MTEPEAAVASRAYAKVHLRWCIRRDMPEVLAIESDRPHPWSEGDFTYYARMSDAICMVAELPDESIAGFFVYRFRPKGLRLLNFSVHPSHRRRLVGVQMARKLASKLTSGRTRIVASVRESDTPFHLFLRSVGFLASRVDRDAFEDTREDAYVFKFQPGGPAR